MTLDELISMIYEPVHLGDTEEVKALISEYVIECLKSVEVEDWAVDSGDCLKVRETDAFQHLCNAEWRAKKLELIESLTKESL